MKTIDTDSLYEDLSGDYVFLRKVIKVFLIELVTFRSLLETAEQRRDWKKLEENLYKLRASCSTMGAERAEISALRTEAAIVSGVNIGSKFEVFKNDLDKTIDAYSRYLVSMTG